MKISKIWVLVPLKLVLGLGIWLALRLFTSWPSMSANYLLVLLLWWNFDCKQIEEVSLLNIRLLVELVVRAFFQLGSLSIEMILRLGTGETV